MHVSTVDQELGSDENTMVWSSWRMVTIWRSWIWPWSKRRRRFWIRTHERRRWRTTHSWKRNPSRKHRFPKPTCYLEQSILNSLHIANDLIMQQIVVSYCRVEKTYRTYTEIIPAQSHHVEIHTW